MAKLRNTISSASSARADIPHETRIKKAVSGRLRTLEFTLPLRVAFVIPSATRIQKQSFSRLMSGPPPLGIAMLAAIAQTEGAEVQIIEQFYSGESNQDVLAKLLQFRPTVVGFSCLTPSVANVCEMARSLRRTIPNCLLLAGNAHASEYPTSLLSPDGIDVVVHGEGESALREILVGIKTGDKLSRIAGLSYCQPDGKIVRTQPRSTLDELDTLPRPAWGLFNRRHYRAPLSFLTATREQILAVQLSRGCPWKCTYCAQNFARSDTRRRDPEAVADEVAWLHRTYGTTQFGFVDAVFPLSERDGIVFAEALLRRNLEGKLKYLATTRVDRVWREPFALLARSGLHIAYLGIETGSDATLAKVNKGTNADAARHAVEILRSVGILSYGLFMLGLPGDTRKSLQRTLDFALELDCDVASFSRMTPYAGSPMDREDQYMATRVNYGLADNWLESSETLQPGTQLRIGDIAAFQSHAMRRYYLRPKKIVDFALHRSIPFADLALGATELVKQTLRSKLQFRTALFSTAEIGR